MQNSNFSNLIKITLYLYEISCVLWLLIFVFISNLPVTSVTQISKVTDLVTEWLLILPNKISLFYALFQIDGLRLLKLLAFDTSPPCGLFFLCFGG